MTALSVAYPETPLSRLDLCVLSRDTHIAKGNEGTPSASDDGPSTNLPDSGDIFRGARKKQN